MLLQESPVAGADETGMRVDGSLWWLHIMRDDQWTLYYLSERRGCEAMDAMGILLTFAGILVHDHWKSYFAYAAVHVLCNAHHLRELQGVVDRDANKLALRLMKLLTLSWHFCKKYKAAGLTQMPGAIQLRIEKIYDQILQRALTKEAAYMESNARCLDERRSGIPRLTTCSKGSLSLRLKRYASCRTFQFPSITMAVNVMPGWPNLSRRSQAASEAKTEVPCLPESEAIYRLLKSRD